MRVIVQLQMATLVIFSVLFALVKGQNSVISLWLGGASYVIPTTLSVFILEFLKPYPTLSGVGFIVAESLKIVLALILMTLIVVLYPHIQFLPFFIGLLLVSHVVFLFYLRVHRYGK